MQRTLIARAGWMLACALGVALAAPSPSHAQATRKCADERTQMDMNFCAARASQEAVREMEAAYGVLMARMDAPAKKELREAQRAWIAFRDAHCTFEAHTAEGGSLEPYLDAICTEALTRQRTEQLRSSPRRAN